MDLKNSATLVIGELLRTVEVIGVEQTANALKSARSSSLTLEDKRVDFVMKMVSSHYLLPIEEIINSHSKKTNRIFALKFSVYYLYNAFDFSFGDLQTLFKRDKSMLSRINKEMSGIDSSNEASLKKIKGKFDLQVNEYILSQQKK